MAKMLRRVCGRLAILSAAVSAVLLAGDVLGQNKNVNVDAAIKSGVSDADVVASMKQGIDFLLRTRKDDNWETAKPGGQGNQYGGKTALALYALLHAGESLLDDEQYAAKLHWRSNEMKPSVEWLSKVEPEATYSASLMAAALSLVPSKPGSPTYKGLERCRNYLLDAMGDDGGYSYVDPKPGDGLNRYGGGKLDNSLQAALDKAKQEMQKAMGEAAKAKKIEDAIKHADNYFKNTRTYLDKLNEAAVVATKSNNKGALGALRSEYKATLAEMIKQYDQFLRLLTAQEKTNDAQKYRDQAKADIEKYKRFGEVAEDAEDNSPFKPMGDLSNGQYGTLGAWALADAGMEIPMRYWSISDRFWRRTQTAAGDWPYGSGSKDGKESMGVAGIASVYVTSDMLDDELRLEPRADKTLERGLAWLDKSFKANTGDLYYMYGVERVGLASGLKFFGQTDWYKEGAANIIARQMKDGSWKGGFHGADQTVATSYALLFLARGRNAVVFNKLQHDGWWNARPRDNANITHWMSKRFEKPINWQVVNLKVDPEQWLDAPILLITGSKDPKFKDEDIAKLRAYVQAGGMIFSTADGDSTEFTAAMKAAAEKIVDRRYEWRQLPNDHVLFNIHFDIKKPPVMLGMSNGVRDLWVHSTVDMSASWQMRRTANAADHFNVPANLFFYATGKGSLRSKLNPLAVAGANAQAARTITVARLDHTGNADPEPGAWKRFAKTARSGFKTDLQISENVGAAALNASGKAPMVLHITGSTAVAKNANLAADLKKYVEGGGTIFVDAAGGQAQFGQSAVALLNDILPNQTLMPIDAGDALIKGTMPDGVDCSTIEYRKFAKLKNPRAGKSPELLGIKIGDRWAIIYSPQDVTSGLLGTNTWGIVGYDPASAEKIARNVVLYAASHNAAAAAAP